MSWIEDTQKAIKYIESKLHESVSAEEAAGHIGYTSNYFQKMFLIVTGYTISEYVRNRRLSLAGRELADDDCKVIDVALKYGYECV